MKKIMICLLSLGMIAGCAQQPIEPPIEPPVVEEPEEQPEEPPIEEEQPEIDEFILSAYTMSEIEQLAKNYSDATGKKDETIPYLITKEIQQSTNELELGAIINESSNELFNWMTSIDANIFYNEYLELNLEGEFVEHFNLLLENFYYPSEKGFVAHFLAGKTEENDGILSVILRFRVSASSNMHLHQKITSYNFDLSTNKPLTNSQLLKKYGLTVEKAQDIVNKQLTEKGMKPYDDVYLSDDADISNIYYSKLFDGMNMNTLYAPKLCATITEESVFYLNEDGKLNMLVFIAESTHIEYEGNITNYFVVKF